jgi:hypothetical protein
MAKSGKKKKISAVTVSHLKKARGRKVSRKGRGKKSSAIKA